MKTIINHQQPLLKLCATKFSLLWSSLLSSLDHGVCMHVQKKFTNLKQKLQVVRPSLVLIDLGRRVIEFSKALVLASTVNSRVYVGLLLIGTAYPLCSCSHMLFSREVVNEGWYYEHYADLFLVIGPYLSVFFCMLGTYLLQPIKDNNGKRNYRSMALFIPMGLSLGKVLWLLQVQSNEEFWNLPPTSFVFYGLLIGTLLPTVLDWTIWRKFHEFDAKMARPLGLVTISSMPEEEKTRLKNEITKAKTFTF